jgi:lysophospholipase L1-like esterase
MRIGCLSSLARGISLLSAVLVACACGAPAPGGKPLPENALRASVPRYVGRFDGRKLTWSGSAIEARFAGSGIALRLRVGPVPAARADESALYSVKIDDEPPRIFSVTPGEGRYVLGEKLHPGQPHTVVVTRETEALAGVHEVLGLELVPGGELLPLPKDRDERREIEIIGDSITCGYGILGEDPSCKFSFGTERISETYGVLASRALGVDAATVCWSGRGVYRNYDEPDEPTMPQLWRPVRAPKRLPSAVVVNLGTNDVLAPRAPFDAKAFEEAYVSFLDRIRDAYPKPRILVAVSPMLEGANRALVVASLERIVARRRSDGDARLDLVVFEEQGKRVGCDSHPNREMHRVMAKQLEETLRSKLGEVTP